MSNNVGTKIKKIATIILTLAILASIIAGLCLITASSELIYIGIIIIIAGPILAWVTTTFIFGFGEMIERLINIDQKLDLTLVERNTDFWVCSKCNTHVINGNEVCPTCGNKPNS